jgi:hypothetical protein
VDRAILAARQSVVHRAMVNGSSPASKTVTVAQLQGALAILADDLERLEGHKARAKFASHGTFIILLVVLSVTLPLVIAHGDLYAGPLSLAGQEIADRLLRV